MKTVSKIILFIWLLFIAFEALMRYYFIKLGMPYLIYIKDILLIILLFIYILNIAYRGSINKFIICSFYILIIHGVIIGLLNNLNVFQILFGLKNFLPFFAGFIAIYEYEISENYIQYLFRIFIPVIFTGLIMEKYSSFPWKGMSYELGEYSIEVARSWSTFGITRLSGFGRSSFETAILLFSLSSLYLATKYVNNTHLKLPARIYDNLLIVICFIGLLLTTSKASVVAFILFTGIYLLMAGLDKTGFLLKSFTKFSIKFILVSLLTLGVSVTSIALLNQSILLDHLKLKDPLSYFLLSSFIVRIQEIWTGALKLLSDSIMVLIGRGLGGIGTAQQHFETGLYNPADSVFIYLLVEYGIIILCFILLYILFNLIFMKLNIRENAYFVFFCTIILSYGMILNMIDSPTLMILIGILLSLRERALTVLT